MIAYRKTYELTGYCADADTWCIDCTYQRYGADPDPVGYRAMGADEPDYDYDEWLDRGGNRISSITLGDEWDYVPVCAGCLDEIECTVIGAAEPD